jgi:hypothetical protein
VCAEDGAGAGFGFLSVGGCGDGEPAGGEWGVSWNADCGLRIADWVWEDGEWAVIFVNGLTGFFYEYDYKFSFE